MDLILTTYSFCGKFRYLASHNVQDIISKKKKKILIPENEKDRFSNNKLNSIRAL